MTTSFFEIPTQAQAIVYVIDRSASMGPSGGLAAAKRELLASLSRLPPSAHFQVLAYSSRVEPIPLGAGDGLLLASPGNIQHAVSYIDALYAEGATAHLPALKRALALHADVIYFLTDADDLTTEQVRAVTVLNHGRSVVHAIQLASVRRSADQQALQLLARENHGVYRPVADSP
jgi:hypothetical protein